MLYGPNGEPLGGSEPEERWESWEENAETSLHFGWQSGRLGSAQAQPRLYGVDRDRVRQQTRSAFFVNPLFGAAVEIAVALLIGDVFTYGELAADKTAKDALSDFWDINNLGQLMCSRLVTEYLLDGELCGVFPASDIGNDEAARVAHLDMAGGISIEASVMQGVTGITANDAQGHPITWGQGEFQFTAHNALWNDPRGWPVAMRAVKPAEAYLNLLQHRLNTHDLQGRILGVQTVFVDRKDPNSRAIYQQKANAYRALPKKGGVLTLAKVLADDGKTVISDEINFTTPAAGAGNAEADARGFVRLTALAVLGLPEHYLGEGGNSTRTTADSMTLPAIRAVSRIHAALRSHLDGLFRNDLKRRFGADRLYTLTSYDLKDGGKTKVARKKRVKADKLEVPWVFPTITQDSLSDLIARAESAAAHGWASPQTLSGSLGFDPAEEDTRLAAVGLSFGSPTGVNHAPRQTEPPPSPTTTF